MLSVLEDFVPKDLAKIIRSYEYDLHVNYKLVNEIKSKVKYIKDITFSYIKFETTKGKFAFKYSIFNNNLMELDIKIHNHIKAFSPYNMFSSGKFFYCLGDYYCEGGQQTIEDKFYYFVN